MSSTDIIGWASLAAFALGFAALYWFITRPSRRLEKLLGDGIQFGLRKLEPRSDERAMLEQRIAPFFGGTGAALKLGSAYARIGGNGFLISVAAQTKHGGKTTYRHTEEYVCLESTGLPKPFGIMPAPPNGALSRLALGMMRRMGMEVRNDEPGLLPEFRDQFLIHGSGELRIPTGVQQALLRALRNPYGFDLARTLAGGAGISFLPEGFVIHLATTAGLKTVEQVRGLLEVAEGIETGLRLG